MHKSRLVYAVATCALAMSAQATVLFDSGGFESYTLGNLTGQNGWTSTSASAWQVQTTLALGTKAVQGSGGTSSWAWPAVNYTPGLNEVVSVYNDFAASDPALTATDNTGFYIDVYDLTGSLRVTRFGLSTSSNLIRVAVTAPFNTTTGQFDPAGSLFNVTLTNALLADTFYNLEARLNFTTKTLDLYTGGNLFVANIPFASPAATGIGDADLQVQGNASSNGLNVGYFDNYLVQTIQIPEPASLGAIALSLPLFIRRRKA